MRSITTTCAMAAGLTALLVGVTGAQTGESQKHKAVMMSHLYTGPDGQTHAEEVEAKFTAGSPNEVFKLMAVTGAELHRSVPGTAHDWHTAPRRQYVITLSGQAELEVAGGKRFTWDRDILNWWKTPPVRVTLRKLSATRIA